MGDGTETGTQTQIDWAKFEPSATSGDFLKLKDGEKHIIGITGLSPSKGEFDRKQPDGTTKKEIVDQIAVGIDYLDGKKLDKPIVFNTSAKYLAQLLKKYQDNNMFSQMFFEIERKGTEKATKYTLVPVQPRPKF